MAVMDEFREEREQIKTASARVKWQYFKDYYLFWVLGGLFLAVVMGAFIFSVLRQKETVFYAALINLSPLESAETEVTEAFAETCLEDPGHEQIVLDTSIQLIAHGGEGTAPEGTDQPDVTDIMRYSYEEEEKLTLLVMTGGIDVIVTGQDVYEQFVPAGWFMDLTPILGQETVRELEAADRLLYAEGVPVGVRLDGASLLDDHYVYIGEGSPALYAGVVTGSQHTAASAAFMDFLRK